MQKIAFNKNTLVKCILECLRQYHASSFEFGELNRLLACIQAFEKEVIELSFSDITVEI